MAQSKKGKKKSANALKRYWKILGLVRREYAKNKVKFNIKDLREETSRIYPLLKDLPLNKIGKDKVANASKVEPTKKKPKTRKEQPYIEPSLLEPQPYYVAATNYPLWIDDSSTDAVFISKISPEGYEQIQGGEYADYDLYFKNFTSHCNSLVNEGQDPYELYTTVEPEYDEEQDKWVFNIVSGRFNGEDFEQDDFGFDPTAPLQIVEYTPKERPESKESKKDEPTTNRIEQAQILEIEKTGKLERLEKKKEGILKEIETYARIGKAGEKRLNEAFDRLDAINKQIDEI